MECVATSMPAIIAGETIQCPGVTSQEVKQNGTPGKTMMGGGRKKQSLPLEQQRHFSKRSKYNANAH